MDKFPILGTEIAAMLGRTTIMHRLWTELTKRTPSNLSIIGPRYAGKTVIMNALAQRAVRENSPYRFVLYWHLGHIVPASDDEFILQLCEKLRDCLSNVTGDISEYRKLLLEPTFSNLIEVMEFLDSEKNPVLMLWDGLDKPLGHGKLTLSLWDQMREIFYGQKHKIVTETRKPLRELIRSQECDTSPFWNIFDMNPVQVGMFDDRDVDEILQSLAEHTFQPGAKTELINWSAGCPPLLLEILNQIAIDIPRGQVDNQAINSAAGKAAEKLSGMISDMWGDCPAAAQDQFFHLMDYEYLLSTDVGKEERRCLMEKGFARESGNKLIASCRMLQEHIRDTKSDSGTMARLFGTWENYQSNIRSLLERRLAQIYPFDERLHRLVSLAIEGIPECPDDCLNNLTNIEERALDLIWQREFGQSKSIPQEIIQYWDEVNRKLPQRQQSQISGMVPPDRGPQCGLLQILTGSKYGFESKAKYISKDTYVLINAIHSFRNRGEHADGQLMHVGVAVAAVMICLELLACLDRELTS